MSVIHAIVLGIIQGLTEFLPVSSSGHLIFIPKFLGWADQGSVFDAALNIGTLLALIIFFRAKLWMIVKSMMRIHGSNADMADAMQNRRLGYLLILSTIPAAIVGLLMKTNDRNALLVGCDMIFWAIVLWIADRYSRKQSASSADKESMRTLKQVTWKDAVFAGCAQAIALLPGTSRSGITMTAGLFRKFDRATAAEFSFLMSVPIIGLACADSLWNIFRHGASSEGGLALVIGLIASFVSGMVAISFLMKIIKKWSFTPFVVYRIVVGVLILVLLR